MRNVFREIGAALSEVVDGLFDIWDAVFEDNPQNMSYDFLDVLVETYHEEMAALDEEDEELVDEYAPGESMGGPRSALHVPLTSLPVYVSSSTYRAIAPMTPEEKPPPPKTRFTEIILPTR